jgi:GTPase SAR1 family protein
MQEDYLLNNIFIEGIQGSGKSTLLNQLQKRLPDYKAYREGDLSPVELAWCSYMTIQQYEKVCNRYQDIASEIEAHTATEGDKKITAYTQILTDIPGFHKSMEEYEIYNGRVSYPEFKDIIFRRYSSFQGNGNIFECSFFQNSIECMMLFYQMSEKEIKDFYLEAYELLKSKNFRLLYLDVKDVALTIETIRKERVDTKGNELWYPLMIRYLSESPFGKAHNLKNFHGLIYHLKRRMKLEKSILDLIGKDVLVLDSKNYEMDNIIHWCGSR